MPSKEESAARHRMVVEEVEIPEKTSTHEEERVVEEKKPEILDEGITAEETPETISEEKVTMRPVETKPQELRKEKSPVFWILIPGIFILGAILGGIVFYQKEVNSIDVNETSTPIATEAPATSASPSPTPIAKETDVSEFDVAVLNGSGIAGEAGKAKTLLTEADFNVVSSGNASTYDYTKTIIKAKSTVDDSVIEALEKALSKNYEVGDSQTLASSSTTDIQVVIGSSKAK